MGVAQTQITLTNPKSADLAPIEAEALVDAGALHLCIPETVVLQLGLEELEKREATVADGSKRLVPYVGPLRTSSGRRSRYAGAMVLGDSVLLGAIPMEDMDLVMRPSTRDLVANLKSPHIPASVAMGVRYR